MGMGRVSAEKEQAGEKEEYIQIKGGQVWLTTEKEAVYTVVSGTVLVYLIPYQGGRPGRRHLLAEAGKGERIPSLCWEDEILGSWRFVLAPLECAKLKKNIPYNIEEIKLAFAKKTGMFLPGAEEFEEQVIEQYNINSIKEEGVIYAASLEQESIRQQGIKIVQEAFRGRKAPAETMASGSRLYDAAARVCKKLGIEIAALDNIRESCKGRFDLEDIGKNSHFVSRKIILEEGWYQKDTGPFIAYRRTDHMPVACIPKGAGKYLAYDDSPKGPRNIEGYYAEQLEPMADMIYRPFPAEKMTWRKLMAFGMKSAGKRDLVSLGFLALTGTLIGLLLPALNQRLYDDYIPMADVEGLVQVCFVILACTTGNLGFAIVRNLSVFRSMSAMEYTVQSAVYDRLFHLPESFFSQWESADLAQRAMGVSTIFRVLADSAVKALLCAVFSLLYVWRMYCYSPELTGTAILLAALFTLLMGAMGYGQIKYESRKMELDGKTASLMYQFLTGISKIRIAGAENRMLYEYLKPYSESRKCTMQKEKIGVAASVISAAAPAVCAMVFYSRIGNGGALSVGGFLAFLSAFGAFFGALLQAGEVFLDVNSVIPAYRRSRPVLETLPEAEDGVLRPGTLSGEMEINNVSFSYQTGDPVLKGISFQVKAGEFIGIVGPSGCGKSTLFKLLLGFEQPRQGKIFYDGKDVESMNKEGLRENFGVVLQDGALISGSIYDNIAIAASGVSEKRVKEVIEEVGLKEDVAQMPMGLHTVLTEGSGTISGGQKQRILIARAIAAKPRILFFDEATSALDNHTQHKISESLGRMKATRIVIAHRLSTVAACDRILVMDHGRIAEQGTYTELMEQKGMFYRMAGRQLL